MSLDFFIERSILPAPIFPWERNFLFFPAVCFWIFVFSNAKKYYSKTGFHCGEIKRTVRCV